MACKYFNEDYLGFCGATAFSYVPGIGEMEQLCFKDFHTCLIYNEYENSHTPVGSRSDQKYNFFANDALKG